MAGVPNTVQSPLWQTLASLPEPACIAAIARQSGLNPRSVKFRLRAWARDGLLISYPAQPMRWQPTGSGEPCFRGETSRRVWAELVRLAPATGPALVAASGVERSHVLGLLARWCGLGIVHLSTGVPVTYSPPVAAKRPSARRTARDRMWTAIRVLRRFDIPTLAIAAEASQKAAKNFAGILVKAGFLERPGAGHASPGEWASYRLIRRSGPLTPIARGQGAEREVFDPNNLEVHPAPADRRARGVNHAR